MSNSRVGNRKQQARTRSLTLDVPLVQCRLGRKVVAEIGNLVTTSSSIVTIPIIDTPPSGIPATGGTVTIDGYMQAFIDEVHGVGPPNTRGDIEITVLNIAGCSATPNRRETRGRRVRHFARSRSLDYSSITSGDVDTGQV